jgi:hypothetical protein
VAHSRAHRPGSTLSFGRDALNSVAAQYTTMQTVFVLRYAGFFHFVKSHCDPLGELTAALDCYHDVAASLIVLPEAFNLGREYDPNYTPKAKPLLDEHFVLEKLGDMAKTRTVVFVVSVIEINTRLNSAYFVDADKPRLMCFKMMDDQSQEYEPCTINCQWENPVRYHEEMCIGALICADANDNRKGDPGSVGGIVQASLERRDSLLSKLNGKRNVVCVPAYMYTVQNDPDIRGCGLILANSRPRCRSFIKDRTGAILRESNGLRNHIWLEKLCRITARE